MSKAGLIASPARGRFVATEKGKALLATGPARIDVALLMQEPEFREFYRSEGAAVEQDGIGPKPVETPPLPDDAGRADRRGSRGTAGSPARRVAAAHPRE
jgi:restriction system protein